MITENFLQGSKDCPGRYRYQDLSKCPRKRTLISFEADSISFNFWVIQEGFTKIQKFLSKHGDAVLVSLFYALIFFVWLGINKVNSNTTTPKMRAEYAAHQPR
jgi:predicted AlkP superfamily pyrophosphatase or phosphodiesterase